MRTKTLALALLLLTMGANSRADEMDEWDASLQADPMKAAQKAMTDAKAREALAAESPDAKKTVDKMNALVKSNPQLQEKVNSMASDIFSAMVKKKQKEMEKGQSAAAAAQGGQVDPMSLMDGISPEQKAKLEELGKEMQLQLNREPASTEKK